MQRSDSKTARTLRYMLTENTGQHFLDSGGTYGRNFQRNAGRDFDAEPEATLEITGPYNDDPDQWYIETSVSTYHFLLARVEYEPALNRRFRKFAASQPEGTYWLELMEAFPETLAYADDGSAFEVTGLYGDGKPFTVNTYNGEDMLSQVLQYTYFELDSEPYIILQIHGGADVRGGYTAPRVFSLSRYDQTAIMDNARADIVCTEPRYGETPGQLMLDGKPAPATDQHYWSTDDTCSWYAEGNGGLGAGKHLEDYGLSLDEADKGKGVIYRDEAGVAHCPLCGGPLVICAPIAS